MRKVMVVDDEPKIVQLARDYLEHAGFAVVVAHDGKAAIATARTEKPDLVVLDLGLPELDGLDVARTLRAESNVPIVMLTGRSEESDKLVGLEIGADDYVTKPFSPKELVARVRAVLRRTERPRFDNEIVRVGEITLDVPRMRTTVAGRAVELTPTEFQLVATMARQPGRVFTRAQLLDAVHGVAFESYERAIDAHVKNIRHKLEGDPAKPQYLLTVYGVGYRFAELEESGEERWGHWRQRPPWWPENEPFPPRRRWGGPMSARSGRFMRRMALFFFAVAVLSVVAATFLFLTLASALGAPDLGGNIARGLVLLIVLAGIVFAARSLRRLAAPVGDVIDAVGRVADGDLSTRVAVRGPREARTLSHAFNAMTSRLEAGEEQRRRLLADVSHELRTPLAVVQGNLEALVDGVHPADETHLAAILEETRVLSRLVEDLGTLSLAESGVLALHREAVDVGALVRETVDSFASQAGPAGVVLEARVSSGLPQVDADPVRTREILSNLIANALRYTPRGGRVSVEAGAEDAGVAIEIRDSGSGIEPERIDRIFDRFYKSPESRGAGLGLAIAKQLVEAHGGRISATSVVGEGTAVRFTMPVESAQSA